METVAVPLKGTRAMAASGSTSTPTTPPGDRRLATTDLSPELIDYVVAKIVDGIDPRRIILFGSHSRRQATASSDLDLLVVQDSGRSSRDVRRQIERLLWGRRFAVDLIVATPQQVDRNVADGNPFYTQHILADGKVLYDRPS